MFRILLGRKFSNKCKRSVKCIKCRIETILKKKQAMVRYLKKDVSDLLAGGYDANALGRIDALIVEVNHASCYDMIEQYCGCLLEHLSTMSKERECPKGAMEAVATLIFAAARFSNLPELVDLRSVFTKRYDSRMESCINKEFVEKMQKKSFSKDKKLQLMEDIAQEFSMNWNAKMFENKMSNQPAPTYGQPMKHKLVTKENEKQSHIGGRMEVANGSDEFSNRKPAPNEAESQETPCNLKYESSSKVLVPKQQLRHDEPPKSSLQKHQVQSKEQRDFQMIPISANIHAHDENEKIMKVTAVELEHAKSDHPDKYRNDSIFEGNAHSKSERACEGIGLDATARHPSSEVVYRDFKTVKMIPPYTKLTEGSNGTIADHEELDHNCLDRWPQRPVNASSCRTFNSKPPYRKPKFNKTPSDTDCVNPTDYEKSTGGQGNDHLKDGLLDKMPKDETFEEDSNVVSQPPTKQGREATRKNGIHGDVYDQQRFITKQTPGSRRRHGSRGTAEATEDGDHEKEEEIMDKLLMHYSNKGTNNELRKGRTKIREANAEPKVVPDNKNLAVWSTALRK